MTQTGEGWGGGMKLPQPLPSRALYGRLAREGPTQEKSHSGQTSVCMHSGVAAKTSRAL